MQTQEQTARRKIVSFPPTLEDQINRVARERGETFSSTLRMLARERLAQLDDRATATVR